MSDYASRIERDEQGRAVRLAFYRVQSEGAGSQGKSGPEVGVTPESGAAAAILACVCGAPRHGRSRFCSRRCKDTAYNRAHPVARQKALPLEPPPAPVVPVRDQRVPRERKATLGGASLRIYRRLEEGPVSNWELAGMFPPATAWRTRLSDVRWSLRQAWGMADDGQPIGHHDCGGGLVWHWLEDKA